MINGVVVFFYVNDIVVTYLLRKKKEADEAIAAIKGKYYL